MRDLTSNSQPNAPAETRKDGMMSIELPCTLKLRHTGGDTRAVLAAAVRRCWPDARAASELPFPEYWRAALMWLDFHAPHVVRGLLWKLADDFAAEARDAASRGESPRIPEVSEKVQAIWERVDKEKGVA